MHNYFNRSYMDKTIKDIYAAILIKFCQKKILSKGLDFASMLSMRVNLSQYRRTVVFNNQNFIFKTKCNADSFKTNASIFFKNITFSINFIYFLFSNFSSSFQIMLLISIC